MVKPTLRQKIDIRLEAGRSVATALEDAIFANLPTDSDSLGIQAHRIKLCNSHQNQWIATDLHTSHGEAYDGSGRFWSCGSKLCPHCLATQSRRNRKTLSARLLDQKLFVGEHWNFLTLTMPNQGIDLLKARHLMNKAWSLFRKRKWFKATFIGGCKSEEFTVTRTGYHYHIHCIVRSKFIQFSKFRAEWTDCLKAAFDDSPYSLSIATIDGMAMANSKRIGSLSEACNEVAKYITKVSSWKKLRSEDLLDIARIKRWPRMFDLFGSLRSSYGVVGCEAEDSSSKKTILDTKDVFDGEPDLSWRRKLHTLGAEKYLYELDKSIENQTFLRKQALKLRYPAAQFKRLRASYEPTVQQVLLRLDQFREARDPRPPPEDRYVSIAPGHIVHVSYLEQMRRHDEKLGE